MRLAEKEVEELRIRVNKEAAEQFRAGMANINEKCRVKRELEKQIWAVIYALHEKEEIRYYENGPYTVALFRITLKDHPPTTGLGVAHRLPGDKHDKKFAEDMALTRAVRQIANILAGF